MHVGDLAGVSASTCCRIVKKVTAAISNLKDDYIKFPTTNEEQLRAKKEFFQIAGFPSIIGTIDCTHVKIQSPGKLYIGLFKLFFVVFYFPFIIYIMPVCTFFLYF